MKVTSVEIIEAKHYLFVKVHTDAGITGLGEAGNWGFLQATKGAIEKFSEFLIGQDPFRIEHHYQQSALWRLLFGTSKAKLLAFRSMSCWVEKQGIRFAPIAAV